MTPQFWFSWGIPAPERELVFAPPRKWRFDFAWPFNKIAVEIEGGAWIGGRHNRASGFIKDAEKYNNAALLGWRVLRYTPQNIDYLQIKKILSGY